ncbi:MAG: enoyl-CoA hydratase-related protein [Myxococcota bacterium]|nr:enoyl-CoA hydratase-related protein [Myxococcota bacterium]
MVQAPVSGPRSSVRPGSERPEAGLRIEDVGALRKLTLDRPSKKNAITRTMYASLTAALVDAATNPRIDVVLLASSGGAFSAGSDLSDFADGLPSPADGEVFARTAGAFLRALSSFPKPIVAAVGGLAVGAGATILLHCDVVVAAQTAAFQFPFTRLAIVPEAGSSVLLAARVGLQRATEWLLFGDRIDAETALRFGLVNAIVHREDLAGAAIARAEALCRLPQGAVRDTKRLLREPLRAAVEDAITRELDAISSCLASPDAAAAYAAFLSRGR